jgi:hypothetical protein
MPCNGIADERDFELTSKQIVVFCVVIFYRDEQVLSRSWDLLVWMDSN